MYSQFTRNFNNKLFRARNQIIIINNINFFFVLHQFIQTPRRTRVSLRLMKIFCSSLSLSLCGAHGACKQSFVGRRCFSEKLFSFAPSFGQQQFSLNQYMFTHIRADCFRSRRRCRISYNLESVIRSTINFSLQLPKSKLELQLER